MTYQEIEDRLKENTQPDQQGYIIADIELQSTAFYENSLTGDCLAKAGQLMGFSQPLLVSQGTLIVSSGKLEVR